MKLPNQSASIMRHSLLRARAIRDDRWRSVMPQQFVIDEVFGPNCIPGCICVSPINCPCCDSLFPWPILGHNIQRLGTGGRLDMPLKIKREP
ncbi:MAG: hypothetical protein F6K10_15420 [Moorea sp. SIO2B7]|nr:hypothetical protein [Moorena sp. SIO2B7]